MKRILTTLCAATGIALALAGCTPGNNVPGSTLFGAGTGAVVGGVATNGNAGGIIGGGLLGGLFGSLIGRGMDRQDEINMQNALAANQVTTWTNPTTGVVYVVEPLQFYRAKTCRTFVTKVKCKGKWHKVRSRACRMTSGTWELAR